MPKETAPTSPIGEEVSGLFDQAMGTLKDSFKVALKAQEDTVRFWSEAVGKAQPMPAAGGELMPATQHHAEEYLRLLEASYRRNADLLKKALHQPSNGAEIALEKRTRDWVEASLALARDNAKDLASTNLRVAQAWTEAFKQGKQAVTSPKMGK